MEQESVREDVHQIAKNTIKVKCVNIEAKDQVFQFLKELETTLNTQLLGPEAMERWIRQKVASAKGDDKQKHLNLPEAAFLNGHVLPELFKLLVRWKLSEEEAKSALLSEYHRMMPNITRQSPIRWERHPFRKALGVDPNDIYEGWMNPERGHALTQSCPDFCLRDPFPHSILFEGKYFPRGSPKLAQRQLVTDIYQAFFYRGLPRLAATEKHPEWKYDYACLLAYDASPAGTLTSAWTALDPRTRCSFWEAANLYVMILRPSTVLVRVGAAETTSRCIESGPESRIDGPKRPRTDYQNGWETGRNVQLRAPAGKFRVVGVDLFSHDDYFVGDFISLPSAFKAADDHNTKRGGSMDDIYYVYDDQGKYIRGNEAVGQQISP